MAMTYLMGRAVLVVLVVLALLGASACSRVAVKQINVLVLGQSNAMHPEIWESFTYWLADARIGAYVINAAQGSTRLVVNPRHWQPPDGEAYLEAIARYEALKSPVIDFVLWHQGEADVKNLKSDWEQEYARAFNEVIVGLDKDIRGAWVLIAAQICSPNFVSPEAIEGVNSAIRNHPRVSMVVDFSDIKLKDDGTHFAEPAKLGKRWAEAVIYFARLPRSK